MRTRFKLLSRHSICLGILAAALSTSCQAESPSIKVEPGVSTLGEKQMLQYKATVTGLSNTKVQWEVNSIVGGDATTGTISASGLYSAPAKLDHGGLKLTVTALGSDGKTKGSVELFVDVPGPVISRVNPDPIAPGNYKVAVYGSGFKQGAKVRNGNVELDTVVVSATALWASGAQTTTTAASLQVSNSDSFWGPAFSVPFKTEGNAPQITPRTVYVHIGNTQQFTASNANYWTTSNGQIYQSGYFVAPKTMPASKTVTITAAGAGGAASATVTLVDGPEPVISPKTVTLGVGETQQFSSPGAATWWADHGTISSTGLYTAPSVWPSNGIDEIHMNGTSGTASEQIKITPPVPVIAGISGDHVALGIFWFNLYGKNFSPSSEVELGGASLHAEYSDGLLKVVGFAMQPGMKQLTVANGNERSQPYSVQMGVKNPKVSAAAARRFLEQAAFGPSSRDAETVQEMGYEAWIAEQLKMPQTSTYKNVSPTDYGGMPEQFLTNAVNQPDQLRQRVAFALSEIFVTSLDEIGINKGMITYQDMLLGDALGNYRQIMSDVTLSPTMGQYLNMANNAKADPSTGSLANENFAREMMQLFTLGTAMLNPDGTVQLDGNGIPIPTYSQFQVTEFARVYTGWTYPPGRGKPVQWDVPPTYYGPMVPYPDEHDSGSKQLLNGYLSPAGASPQEDLDNALNNIFNHPNIGPFVSTQLIQHLVKSNPSPAYVSRVAAVFDNNGKGVRGDMKAVVTAILLDKEARANDDGGNDQPSDGHLQEPPLFIAGMVRAFSGQMNDKNYYHWQLQQMGEDLFSSPSVFNYFAPSYMVPGTNLMGGEFQIYTPNNAVVRANEVSILFSQWSNPVENFGPGTTVDLSPFMPYASNPQMLVEALDLTLTHGVMPAAMKSAVVAAATGETRSPLLRVEKAIYLILTSSYYNVWH